MDNDWCFQRCREVQQEPDEYLDLWAREHYKSTIITFGKTIQDILNDPETTVGIFSHTRPIAKAFLRQIKVEFESNDQLKRLFPEILWADPKKQAVKWSEDEGIIVKRSGNPKEATVEAWGLVDGQPTSKHYRRMIYDDVVTRESINTPEMIKKTTGAWELSRALGSDGGVTRYVGTRYHYFDTYHEMMERGVKSRVYPATVDGTAIGKPVFMSEERLAKKRIEMASTFAAQMLLQPVLSEDAYFQEDWFHWYDYNNPPKHLRKYGASDYAVTSDGGDWTVHGVCGVDENDDLYVLDWWRQRTASHIWIEALLDLMEKHEPLEWAEEAGQIKKSLEPFIVKRQQERKVYCYREQYPSVADKQTRARAFQARASMGKVYLPKNAPWIQDLLMEMWTFGFGQNDDQVDVLSLFGRMLAKMIAGKPPKKKDKPRDRWDRLFDKEEAAESNWKTL